MATWRSPNRLAVPELAEPTIGEDGRKVFDLHFTAGESQLIDAGPSDTWGSTAPTSVPRDDGMMGHSVLVEPGDDPGDRLGDMDGHEH